ncbi:hypothetical protein BLA29_001144 [Euroglyphus maynei]|uniref:DUF7041 domain-containing protein n=1 Tax=Euroglyphus maynei TaxID=6958 RepID=A0A1Y3BQ74_EURMA|nr:hypothetical protein BLA29_001144 [Euroglyphus maynei]
MNENLEKSMEKSIVNKVESVSVKLQEFWETNPETWLKTAEYQFRLAGIVNEETKYYHIASRLPSNVAQSISDILKFDYKAGMYDLLRDALIERYTPSNTARLHALLDEKRGDRKPAKFMRDLINLSQNNFPIDVIIHRWLQNVPPIVAAATEEAANTLIEQFQKESKYDSSRMEKMLKHADNIYDLIERDRQVLAVKTGHSNRNNNNKNRFRSQSRSRRSSSRSRRFNPKGSWCENHFKYREKAYSCLKPDTCKYRPQYKASTSADTKNENTAPRV